jgi:hypothetical protein
MTDADRLFQRLHGYNLGSDTPNVVSVSASLSGTTATLTVTLPSQVSQFDSIMVEATISGGASGGKSVSLECNRPDYSPSSTTDFQYKFHLVPVIGNSAKFELDLSKALRAANKGKPFAVGEAQNITWRLNVVDRLGTEYVSANRSDITLCETNLGDYPEDDLDRAFALLNKLEEAQ